MRVASTKRTSATARVPFDRLDRRAELVPQARLRLAIGAERVQSQQRRPDDGRRARGPHLDRRADLAQALLDRVEQAPVSTLQKAAAEQHLDRFLRQLEPL